MLREAGNNLSLACTRERAKTESKLYDADLRET